jgi:WD40 repeat protein
MSNTAPHVPDYDLLRPIGRGAFGEVWLARGVTGQWRALKVLRRVDLPHPRAFEREFAGVVRYEPISRTQANLIPILHVGRSIDNQSFWYVMELADDVNQASGRRAIEPAPLETVTHSGGKGSAVAEPRQAFESYEPATLSAVLRARGRLPVKECLRIALGIVEAAAHLHEHGLVHRDIKPSNVIFVGGIPKLADVGLVTTTEEVPSFAGTAGYIPPDGPGTRAADIYAFGKLLYQMAAGRPLQDFPRLPEDFTDAADRKALLELNEIILRAADPDPRRRYSSMEDLRSDLVLLEAGRSVRRVHGLERRLRLASQIGVAVAGIASISIGVGVWANHERLRTLKAERALSARFIEQQLVLARATRLTGLPGQRTRTLEVIREAARQTNSLALRNEAIAAVALPDVHHFRTIKGAQTVFDRLLRRYATEDVEGRILIRAVNNDQTLACLSREGGLMPSSASGDIVGWNFSDNGDYFCASSRDRRLLIWRLDSVPRDGDPNAESSGGQHPQERPSRTLALTFEPVRQMAVPGGHLAVIESRAGELYFFDLGEGCEVRKLEGPYNLHRFGFNRDGTRFASLHADVLSIHDLRTGGVQLSLTNGTPFEGVAWHPDGRQVVTWTGERAVRFWNLETGKPSAVFRGHEAEVIGAVADDGGQWLLTTSWDNETVLWNLAQSREVLRMPGAGNIIQFSSDARRLAWRTWSGGQWEVFELTSGPESLWLEQHPAQESTEGLRSLWCLAFLGPELIAGTGDIGLCIWQPPLGYASALGRVNLERPLVVTASGRLFSGNRDGLRHWPIKVDEARNSCHLGPPERISPAALGGVTQFAISSNAVRIAAVTSEYKLFLRTEEHSEEWQELAGGNVLLVAMDPGGHFLAASFRNGGMRVWDAQSGAVITSLPCSALITCGVSPNGEWLAVATAEAFLVWRVADWQLVHRIPHEAASGPVQGWSPDGKWFLVHDLDSRVRILHSGSWEELGSLPSPKLLRQISFSRDGNLLALASEKSGVQLWDLPKVYRRLAELGLEWNEMKTMSPSPRQNQRRWNIRITTGQ